MQRSDLVIVTWHQPYLSSYAGGYVRLRQFLKRIPKNIHFVLLDNKKSIYQDILQKEKIIEYQSPQWITSLQNKAFILWFLLETISSTIILYQQSAKLIKSNGAKVLYFPTGEFLQLYIVSLLLKIRFSHIKVILDILNYGILDKNYSTYFNRLKKSETGFIRSVVITVTIWFSHTLMKYTIRHADYIFTVSREFQNKIKRDYHKSTISFTPSGVEVPRLKKKKIAKFLSIYIGRMTVEKGIYEVISTWNEVVKVIPSAKLALGGYADAVTKAAILKELQEKSIKNNVTFLGDVTEEKKAELLEDSELFIHLAHREPLFPVITILEGWSYGLPTIFYDMSVYESALKEFRFSTNCLYAVKNQSVLQAAKAIVNYTKIPIKEKEKLQKSAKANAAMFSWDVIAKKEWDIISYLIAS